MAKAGTSRSEKTFYLIDGHAQFFRAYYAIRGGMSSPVTGEATHLTFGFIGMLMKLLREDRPDYLAVAIDVGGDHATFRSEIYPEYKANREAPPDDFHPQVERCLELLELMRIPVIGIPGVEADDVIATIAKDVRREHDDVRVRIVSRDKDLTQVIGDGIELFDAMKDEVVTPDVIFKTEGVKPEHVVDILALMGDNVDNVPGVPGIGPKTAAKLILEYGTTENLIAHLDAIKGKRRENLEASKDQIPLAKELVTVKYDVELEFALDSAIWNPADIVADPLLETFRTLNFNSHADGMRSLLSDAGVETPEKSDAPKAGVVENERADEPGLLFGAAASKTPSADAGEDTDHVAERVVHGSYSGLMSVKDIDAYVKKAMKSGRVCLDVETDSVHAMTARLCGVSLSMGDEAAVYIPMRSPEPDSHVNVEDGLAALRPLFEDSSVTKIGHNLKYDLTVLAQHGAPVVGPYFDTMVADYLLEPLRSSHKMDALAEAVLDIRTTPITDLIGTGGGRGKNKTEQKGFDEVPLDDAIAYAAEDADVTWRLADVFEPLLKDHAFDALSRDVEMPLVGVLSLMERNGIRLDPDELDRQRERLLERIEELETRIGDVAPHEFKPGSPKQLAAVLFNTPTDDPPGLGLKVVKRGKTGPSTDREVLEKLAGDPDIESPLPALIVEWRQLTKLVSTYLESLKEAINESTARVHASFNQTVASTGRLSSSDPNLQNIPIRTDVGREIRRAFVAADGFELITADYSQIELRVLAHLSEDPALIEAFEEGADIHRAVAAQVFGVAPDDVTDDQRGAAKMVNFGIVYGITAFGLQRRLAGQAGQKVSRGEAQAIIDDYKTRFAGIESFLQRCIDQAKTEGSVSTILGRRRPIPEINAKNGAQRAFGERTAINTVVQGSAADLIKVAMVNLARDVPTEFPDVDVRLLLQIHDELVFEAPVDGGVSEAVEAFVVGRMEEAMELRVPLVVGSARAREWIDAK